MSVSTQAAPKQISYGRLPAALAMLALLIVIVAVASAAINANKAAAPAVTAAKGAPPPAVIDHGWSSAVVYGESVTGVPFYDHGWSKINEPGQSVTGVPFYDHGWSGINEPGQILSTLPLVKDQGIGSQGPGMAIAAASANSRLYTGPYYENGVLALPQGTTTGPRTPDGPMPYAGPFYYDNGVMVAPFDAGKAKTIDSPYVAPRPRNQ